MPILAAEPNIFPSDLLVVPGINVVPNSESARAAWWVLYTRPRQEKSLARDLLSREIPFYLPLVPRRLLIRGRPVFSHVPLFSGYVFVHGSHEDRLRSLMTNRVAQVFSVDDGDRLRSDLQNIQLLIESGSAIDCRIAPGSESAGARSRGRHGWSGRNRAATQERNPAAGVGKAVAAGRVVGDRRLLAGTDRLDRL